MNIRVARGWIFHYENSDHLRCNFGWAGVGRNKLQPNVFRRAIFGRRLTARLLSGGCQISTDLSAISLICIKTGNNVAPGRGLALAQPCAQCHAVQKEHLQSPNENAPFQVIASVPGMTATALSAALNTSHQSMPNIILEPDERAHIIAYILSLR